MKIVIILGVLGVIFYLYKTSSNNFFEQHPSLLNLARKDLINQLKRYGRSDEYITRSLVSFDYFVLNPSQFDGTTIARDLYDLRYFNPNVRLPIAAMNHDFDWIHGANRNFVKCWKSNWTYFTDLILNGKAPHIERLIGLNMISLIFVPYMFIKNLTKK